MDISQLTSDTATALRSVLDSPQAAEMAADIAAVLAPKLADHITATVREELLRNMSPERLRCMVESMLEGGEVLSFDMEGGKVFPLRKITRKNYRAVRNCWVRAQR